jgi:hypothetical protein
MLQKEGSFVYIYIGTFEQRGGLIQRYDKLIEINDECNTEDFKIVEVPADLNGGIYHGDCQM